MPGKVLVLNLLFCMCVMCGTRPAFAQADIEKQINKFAKQITGNVGVYAVVLETGKAVSFNGSKVFPMQSVYKFPIAMAVFNRIDKSELRLHDTVEILQSEYIPKNGHSPIRDKFPSGCKLTLKEILRYNIEESDGTACDVLLRLLGGTQLATQYVRGLGISDIAIATTEMVQVANDTIQYQNYSTPKAMTQLLQICFDDKRLSEESTSLLFKFMADSKPGANRLKALLPPGTTVAHKTGTAGTINGLTRATNDVGIVLLPGGKRLAISVFISDSYASAEARELIIAKISKAVYYWAVAKRD